MAGIFQSGMFALGFDAEPTAAQVFTQNAIGSATATTPFSFGFAWNVAYTPGPGILFGTNLTTVYHGVRHIGNGSLPGSSAIMFDFYDATAGASQVTLRVNSTGQLQFYLGSGTGTTIGSASAASTIVQGVWQYIEVLVTISATVGQVQCYVNGTQVITTAASQNTKSTANTFVNAFRFDSPSSSNDFYDDWYMLDNTGSSPFNTYLGPVQVREEAPNANSAVGGRNAWTSTDANNYQAVAHIPASASHYDADSTPGDYDMFRFPSLPSNVSTVLAVNELAVVGLDSSGARTVELNVYSNGTDGPGSAFTPAAIGSPTYYYLVQTVDPHTSSAWTVANASAAEIGVKLQS
jgi:hypothetical protein